LNHIKESLRLRRKVGRAFRKSERQARLRMFRQALRFALTTMGYSTQAAESVFMQGRGPLLGMAISKYDAITRRAYDLETIDYRSLYSLMRSHGMEAKASFTLALLGYAGKNGVCPDSHWVETLGYPKGYLTHFIPERTEELRRRIYSRYGLEGSWSHWFRQTEGHTYHVPILRTILSGGCGDSQSLQLRTSCRICGVETDDRCAGCGTPLCSAEKCNIQHRLDVHGIEPDLE
jgi:hypothetical protein